MEQGAIGILVGPPVGWVLAALWGLLWGSFFNVCIHRVGLYESVAWPASRCPNCGTPIRGYDNIPVLSWLILRGRCRSCRSSISIRYPIVEIITALLSVAVYARFVAFGIGGTPLNLLAHFLIYFAFVGVLVVLVGVDLDHMLLPDRITYPAIPIFFVIAVFLGDVPLPQLLIGMLAGYFGVAFFIEAYYRIRGYDGMGYGDAKLLALIGGFMGWHAIVFSFFGGAMIGALIMLPILWLRGSDKRTEFAFGPFIAAGALVYLLFGRYLVFAS